jgi:hypothetical protein
VNPKNRFMSGVAEAFSTDGAQLFRGVVRSWLPALENALAGLPHDEAGTRLHGISSLSPLLATDGCIGAIVAAVLGPSTKAVRAILFNKTVETNWGLGWHQDRTICVKEKREVEGFGPWTIKRGMNHVAPPPHLLAQMVTVRVHLDDVPETNAPLLIAPGSHRLGRVAVDEISGTVERFGIRACLARAGDAWLYATPILHASDASTLPKSRRVLQVDYAGFDLPGGLEWLGV